MDQETNLGNVSTSPSPTRWWLLAVILVFSIGASLAWIAYEGRSSTARALADRKAFNDKLFGMTNPVKNRLDARFTDGNDDLIADPPQDEAEFLDPTPLTFSYVAGKDSARQQKVWKSMVDALAEATARPVEFLVIDRQEDQLEALKEGRLHVAGLNTGAVPIAVNSAGFVPVSVLAKADGSFGYRMQMIVRSDSPVQKLSDVRGHRISFLWRDSNSGFKAPVVILRQDFGLVPDVDYQYGFSMSHDDSIRDILSGKIEIAPVASDMIDRLAGREEIDREKIRVIYESEPFPPATIGMLHQLKPELADKIRRVIAQFPFSGTSLEEEFAPSGVTQLVPVSYQKEWAIVRRIDDAMGYAHEIKSSSVEPADAANDPE